MSSRSVKLPDIGEGVAEAEVTAWHVKVGDLVREDEPLVDVMTDKATVEIPSPVNGKVVFLGAEAGQMLAVGAELVRLDTDAVTGDASSPSDTVADSLSSVAVASAHAQPAVGTLDLPPSEASKANSKPVRGTTTTVPDRTPPTFIAGPPRAAGEKPLASPAVRGRALDAGVDLRRVHGSGPAGRISHEDLDQFLTGDTQPIVAGRIANVSVDEVKIIGLRRRIAQKMADATRCAAHFTYVDEVDVTALEELRGALNKRHVERRPKLTLIPFLVQALVRALPDFPQMNALYDDEAEIVRRYGGVHVGVATQTPSGLMVPVLRHAEMRDLWDVASEVKRLADAARAGSAEREELTGSTITVTSLGALGGLATTPVLNRPEVAILGVNKQIMRPVWRDQAFAPRLMMNLSASFDHRVVDGYDAALFIQGIKALLETPALLFIEG